MIYNYDGPAMADEIIKLRAQLVESEKERLEQARLLGMSGERELALQSRLSESQKVIADQAAVIRGHKWDELTDMVVTAEAKLDCARDALEGLMQAHRVVFQASLFAGFRAGKSNFNKAWNAAADVLADRPGQKSHTPDTTQRPDYYYKGTLTAYTDKDPEVTCPVCLKTFRTDPMDAACRLCGEWFNAWRRKSEKALEQIRQTQEINRRICEIGACIHKKCQSEKVCVAPKHTADCYTTDGVWFCKAGCGAQSGTDNKV